MVTGKDKRRVMAEVGRYYLRVQAELEYPDLSEEEEEYVRRKVQQWEIESRE